MSDEAQREQFVRSMTDCQSLLYAYIYSLVGDANQAQDILQETNIVLWRRCDELCQASDFAGLARRMAYYQVLASRRDQKRDRLLFSDVVVAQLAEGIDARVDEMDQRQEALRRCLDELVPRQRELICQRYRNGMTTAELARKVGRSPGALDVAIHRIRKLLLGCIQRRLAERKNA